MKATLLRQFHALRTRGPTWLRQTIGVLLIIGGLLGFLPVLGYWMLPLGLALLAVDFPIVRRFNRNIQVWWGRLRQRQRGVAPRRERGRTAGRHGSR